MEFCSLKFVVCISAAIFTTQADTTVVVYGQLGKSVTLPNKQQRRGTVRWTKDQQDHKSQQVLSLSSTGGVPLIGPQMKDRVSLDRNGYALVIKRLIPEDFAVFRCEITVGFNTDVTVYKLYQITVSASPAIALASETLTLECNVAKSTVPTQIHWSAPQSRKTEGPRFTSSDHRLTVGNVSEQDHGEWTCTVTYGNMEAVATASVTVVDFSPSPPQPLYTTLSSSSPSILLHCSLHTKFDSVTLRSAGFQGGHWSFTPFPWDAEGSRDPQKFLVLSLGPQLQWQTPQGKRVNGTALETDPLRSDLSIVRRTDERGGIYTCTLNFANRKALSRTLRVEVLRIESSQGNLALVGQPLNLTCTLGHPSLLNNLTVEWITPRHSRAPAIAPLPSSPHQALLSIHQVREKDQGIWQCKLLRDKTLLATATLSLRTERVPVDVWLVVSICGASVALILLLALIFICVRRHRQQRMFVRRRRKTKYCRCKHPQVKGFYKS